MTEQFIDMYAAAEANGEIELEIWSGDEYLATVSGKKADALREALHYALRSAVEYPDLPVRCWQVIHKPYDLEQK